MKKAERERTENTLQRNNLKKNLIILHSFPTNSIVLKGLYDFLGEFFTVYPIDLPGFISTQKPLEKITVQKFTEFTQKKLDELDLDSYIIAGISFGYLIVSYLQLNNRCKAVLALEPFIGKGSLNFEKNQILVLKTIVNLILITKISRLLWKNSTFKRFISKKLFGHLNNETAKLILGEVDGKTFFEVARLIMAYESCGEFINKKPCVLVVNPNDGTVNYKVLKKYFERSFKKLLIVNTEIEHFPKNMTNDYFISKMPKNTFEDIANFIEINKHIPQKV